MFWTILRWGGTVAVVLLAILAALAGGDADAPPDARPVAAKNFNL